MSRPPFPDDAWPVRRTTGLPATGIPIRTVPLNGHDPQRIKVVVRGESASIGYAVHASAPDMQWCIEGPMAAEEGLVRAQLLSSASGLPIVLWRGEQGALSRADGDAG